MSLKKSYLETLERVEILLNMKVVTTVYLAIVHSHSLRALHSPPPPKKQKLYPSSAPFFWQRSEGQKSQGDSRVAESLQLWKHCVEYGGGGRTTNLQLNPGAPECSPQLCRSMSQTCTISVTHRPVVDWSWKEDWHAKTPTREHTWSKWLGRCQVKHSLLKSPKILYSTHKFAHWQSWSWLELSWMESVCPGRTLSYIPCRSGWVTFHPCTVRQWSMRCQPHGKLQYFQVILVKELVFPDWNIKETMGKIMQWLVLL